MILQSLNALYDRLAKDPSYEIAPPGFSPQKISFRVVLRPDGTLVAIEDARLPDKKGKLQNLVMEVPGGAKPPGAGVNPCFLWDNQTYLLGRQPEDKADGFGQARFDAFKQRHIDIEKEVNTPEFSAICRFLENWQPDELVNHPVLDTVGTGFGVFQIQGEKKYVHQDSHIRNWWKMNQTNDEKEELGQCLITGEQTPIARLHPKIKSVAGAQSAGASIVSFNDTAYESYGKSQGDNAPVGKAVAFQYGTALNALLSSPQSHKHRLRIGDTTTVFWTEKPTLVENGLAELLGTGSNAPIEIQDPEQRDKVERLLKAVRSGQKFNGLGEDADTPFFILGLAPNAARLSIRFFHRSSTQELLTKLHEHQAALEIVREWTEAKGQRQPDPEFPAIWQILRQTARVADEIPPLLGGSLTRAIIEGSRYPEGLYSAIIRRIQADRTINYLRAATLKAILTRNHKQTISTMLDTTNTDTAYLLGRLFSALEKTQEDSLGSLNAGLRDKFYSSASATPASVFPRILRTYQHWLSKLTGGAKVNRERLIQDIISHISASGFPSQLNLKNQGVFAIGYYHQRKDFFTKKETADKISND